MRKIPTRNGTQPAPWRGSGGLGVEGLTTIKAVRFDETPPPDFYRENKD